MESENENQLKIRKPPFLLRQEELLAEKVKKYPSLFDKSQKPHKERDVVKSTWEAVASELHFIEDGMQPMIQFIS